MLKSFSFAFSLEIGSAKNINLKYNISLLVYFVQNYPVQNVLYLSIERDPKTEKSYDKSTVNSIGCCL